MHGNHTDTPWTDILQFTQSPDWPNFSELWTTWGMTFLKLASKFSSLEWNRNDKKVAEEYCWAITQSCCCRSGSSVLEFGFKLDRLAYTYIKVKAIPLHTKKALRGGRGVVNATLRPLYPRERDLYTLHRRRSGPQSRNGLIRKMSTSPDIHK